MRKMIVICMVAAVVIARPAEARKFVLSTNVLDYANFGTLNVEGGFGIARKWSLGVSAKYNPFVFNRGIPGKQVQNKQQSYAAGVKYWPWHVWSGWWVAANLRYQEYNAGGIVSQKTEEGDRFGAGLSAGYSLMVHPHLNLDFGLGLWTGWSSFIRYSCPSCGTTETRGKKVFLLPDNILLSLVYVF